MSNSVVINIYFNSDGSVSVKTPPPSAPKPAQAVIDDPVPPVDASDPFSTPGIEEDDPYGVRPPKTTTAAAAGEPAFPPPAPEAAFQQPEPVDTLTELARSLAWLDVASNPLEAAVTILNFHPLAAKEFAKANSVDELDKVITGIGTTKASEVGGRVRENPSWAGKLMIRLRVGLGMGPPTGLKPETPAPETPKGSGEEKK